jgi:Ser/Thr protein kinase RdoA (MazF antagonist)
VAGQTRRVSGAAVDAEVLAAWGLEVHEREPVDVGLNSRVWAARTDAGPLVLKLVSDRDPFVAGLEVAERIAADVRSGPPLRTRGGQLALETDHGWLAVLRREPGRPLQLSHEPDRLRWGTRLGELHRRLVDLDVTEPLSVWPWDWLDIDAGHLRGDPALRDAIARARDVAERYVDRHRPELGVIHGDPNPQEFLLDHTGDLAVVDWGAVQHGPLVYDMASARWFAGSDRSFRVTLDAYQRASSATVSSTGLQVFLRYRHAVQAWYFSHRIALGDTTGTDCAFNRTGLEEARSALAVQELT